MNRIQVVGPLLFTGVATFTIVMIVCEALRPGYSVSRDYISSLGVGSNAVLFNAAVVFLGVILVISGIILLKSGKIELWVPAMIMSGCGAIGVGFFPMGSPYSLHIVFSAIVFGFGGISALLFALIKETPLRFLSLASAIFSLSALGLYATENYLQLGAGGMERMIAYPEILWMMAVSGFLMNKRTENDSQISV